MKNILSQAKTLVSPKEQGADFVELFFDLVFVYAITRITALSAHDFSAEHILQSVLIFWLIWWGWTQFTWTLNAANTKIAEVRLMVLIATGVAFIMASSVGEAFGPGVMWFALPYVIIRAIGLGMYARVTSSSNGSKARVYAFAIPSILGLTMVLIGAFVDPVFRAWWWIGAIGFDMFAGYLGGRADGWDLNISHFAERHGLIVIIALGESLIVAAHAFSKQNRADELIIVGALAVLVTCLLWWSYFSWIHEHFEGSLSKISGIKQTAIARDIYSFIHFPLLIGIIGVAVGFENILAHPDEPLSMANAVALFGGYIFFVGFTGASVWRLSNTILIPRILILIISIIGIFFSIGKMPYIALIIIALGLSIIILTELKKSRLE